MIARQDDRPRVSTGMTGLDRVIDDLRIGDNVVWRVDRLEDYEDMIRPFVRAAGECQRTIIYLRFGRHPALVDPGPGVRIVTLEALNGFEAFTSRVHELIGLHGRGAFYVFDCLSDLLSDWATDLMVGNFFRVVCPYLFELDTVAYFGLLAQRHSHRTMARIRQTTQVLIDVRRTGEVCHVQPVKLWKRQAPTMFLPHRRMGDAFIPVTDSSEATRVQAALGLDPGDATRRQLDHWDAIFLQAAQHATPEADAGLRALQVDRLCQLLLGRDERILDLARSCMDIPELLAIRARMIGSGYIGGKAVGMLLARQILLTRDPATWQRHLEPHDSFFMGTDVYYSFLVHNGLWNVLMRQRKAGEYYSAGAELHARILEGQLPEETRTELSRMLDYFGQYPILVRSSSLLEDGYGNAFAGKYDSVFLVNQGSPQERMEQLECAIRQVFASTMGPDALAYRRQRGLDQLEEPMALLIQRVNGRYHGAHYLPDAAGVALSRNTFNWDAEMDPAAGMVRIVLGLGTRAVDRNDGDYPCIISLDQADRRPFHDAVEARRYAQHQVDALDIEGNRLVSLSPRQWAGLGNAMLSNLKWCAEPDLDATARSRQAGGPVVWHLNFAPLTGRTRFVPLMRQLLGTLESRYDYPVDVEFTLHLNEDGFVSFNLVQCRPLQTLGAEQRVQLPEAMSATQILMASQGHFMGGNMDQPITRVIRIDPLAYGQLDLHGKYAVARLIGRLNQSIESRDACPTMLIGPGRWGSSSPELGVPIRFADMSRIAVLVEVAELARGIMPDLSYGSHFFQDLVEAQIAYVALRPGDPRNEYHPEWLRACPCRHFQPDADDGLGEHVVAAVEIYETGETGLRLMADVVSQRLICIGNTPVA